MAGSITLLKSSRLTVLDSSSWMTSLAGSSFKTEGEEDPLNFKIVAALLFIMNAHYLVISKYLS